MSLRSDQSHGLTNSIDLPKALEAEIQSNKVQGPHQFEAMSPRSDQIHGDETNSLDHAKASEAEIQSNKVHDLFETMSPRSDRSPPDIAKASEAKIQSNKVQGPHLFEEMSQRSDGDKTNPLDLAKALEAEIQSKMPNPFVFTIHDHDDPFDSWGFDGYKRGRRDGEIFLSREFDGEKIMVKVEKPYFSRYHRRSISDYSRSSDDSYSDSDGGVSDADPLKLVVRISKNGRYLSFNVSAAAGYVTVDSMRVKGTSDDNYSEEYKVERNSNLQGALREYLRARGIEKSTTDFLYDYMLRKSKKQPEIVLKKVLKFLKK